jgi:hypothetical protein
MPLYHATLTCAGVTDAEAVDAPADVEQEFRQRPWHKNVRCRWDGRLLWLDADNDYDEDGKALLDEFSDVVIACVRVSGTIRFEIVSVRPVPIGTSDSQ